MRELAEALRTFFERTVEDWEPERAIPESDKIKTELVELWSVGASVPTDDVAQLLEPTISAFAERIDDWRLVIRLASVYFRSVSVPEDRPLAHGPTYTMKDGVKHFSVRTGIAEHLIVALFNHGPTATRANGLMAVAQEEWSVLGRHEGEAPLAKLELSVDELKRVLPALHELTRRDLMAGEIQRAVKLWGTRHPGIARDLVDAWANGEPSSRPVADVMVQMLAEGYIDATPEGWEHWRNRLTARLYEGRRPNEWAMAVRIAAFGWPDPLPPADERHEELLEALRSRPTLLAGPGLDVCIRDARAHPVTSARTAIAILEILPQEDLWHPDIVGRLAHLAQQAAFGAEDQDSVRDLICLLPWLRLLPATHWRGSGADQLLEDLYRAGQSMAVTRFMGDWLELHAHELQASHVAFREVFALLVGIGERDTLSMLLELLADQRPPVYQQAGRFIQAERSEPDLDLAVISAYSATKCAVLIYRLLALQLADRTSLLLALGLVEARPEVVDEVGDALRKWLPRETPGYARELAEQRLERSKLPTELGELLQHVVAELDRRETLLPIMAECGFLRGTRPTGARWVALINEQVREKESEYRESGRSLMSILAMRIPIARGGSSVMPSSDATTDFQEISVEIEGSSWEAVDPLGRARARQTWRDRADELLRESK